MAPQAHTSESRSEVEGTIEEGLESRLGRRKCVSGVPGLSLWLLTGDQMGALSCCPGTARCHVPSHAC